MSRGVAVAFSAALILLAGCVPNSPIAEPEPLFPAGAVSTGNFEPRLSPKFEIPWSTEVSRQEMIETSLYKLFSDLDSIFVEDCHVQANIFVGDPFLDEHVPLLEAISNGMVSSYCNYLSKDIPVIAGSYEFVKEVVKSENLPADQYGGICGNDVIEDFASGCASFGSVWTGIQLGTVRGGVAFVEDRRLTIAAHEIMHNIHDQINPKGEPGLGSCRGQMNFSCAGPVWFYEGAGEFFGRAMTQYLGLQNYATFVPNDRSGRYLDGAYLSDLDFLTTRRNKAFGVENYYSGQVAMELLIANKGLLAVLEIWQNLHRGHVFPVAFELAMGIGLNDFYQVFKELHSRLYNEAGYCDSNIGCDSWNPPEVLPNWYASPNSEEQTSDESKPEISRDGAIDKDCIEANETWWSKCTELELAIPELAENSDHGYPLEYSEIPKIRSCDELTLIGFDIDGWAVSFSARDNTAASEAYVSTQYYAALRYLDTNLDGLVCSAQVPD